MAAAGRDVSLAPSIQLPCDGLSPCFIIIPIISLGGGPRPRSLALSRSLSLAPSFSHTRSPVHALVTCSVKFKHACSKTYSSTRALPLRDTEQGSSCLHPLKYESRSAAESTRAPIRESRVLDLFTRRESRQTRWRLLRVNWHQSACTHAL